MKDSRFLFQQIVRKRSFLCIGLDPDLTKIPKSFLQSKTALTDYCKLVIDNTHDLAIAYKLNLAFFECYGANGWDQFEDLVKYIPSECLVIADAKRADIGNTSAMYAKYYFERANVDALTLHPYMGIDSLEPFSNYKDKWLIILALTSNFGAKDFEMLQVQADKQYLYEHVLQKFRDCAFSEQIMFVVGATHPAHFINVRKQVPDHFLLVPGIGEQGGDLIQTMENGANSTGGLIINVGRKILFPTAGDDHAFQIRNAALAYQEIMGKFIDQQAYSVS
jgi:orotidine-5'-phosphate decarboxylase